MSTSYRPFPLAIKVSTRIRISEEERQNLITTYNQQLERGDLINHKLGMNNSTFLELVKGRDSLSIPFILKIQNALGIEIVSKDRLTQSCREYINFIFHKTHSSNNGNKQAAENSAIQTLSNEEEFIYILSTNSN